jgi:hypothetical protein
MVRAQPQTEELGLDPFELGCLNPIQIVYVPTPLLTSKGCPDNALLQTKAGTEKSELEVVLL